MKNILIFSLLLVLFGSCGNSSNNSSNAEDQNLDSIPDSSKVTCPIHQADNFFCFDENSNIFVGNSADNLEITDVNGYNPTISPDGKLVAYTNMVGDHRCISLYDIKSKNNKILNFPVDNEVYMGSFSPDGNYLAVNYFKDSEWTIALYDLKKDTFKLFLKDNENGYYQPRFSTNGKKLLFHDMNNVYIYDFGNGKAAQKQIISCDNFCQDNDMGLSSANSFQMTDDEKYIYFDYCSYSNPKVEELNALAVYRMEDGQVTYLSDRKKKNVLDFHISVDGSVYYLEMSSVKSDVAKLYMTREPDFKPVKVSDKKFQIPCSFYLAY